MLRARYSAYVLLLEEYLLETWHPSSRPPDFCLAETYNTRWLGLDIRSQVHAGDRTRIEFVARYRIGTAPAQQQNEISRFVREDGRWLYLDGEIPLPAPTYVNPRKR